MQMKVADNVCLLVASGPNLLRPEERLLLAEEARAAA